MNHEAAVTALLARIERPVILAVPEEVLQQAMKAMDAAAFDPGLPFPLREDLARAIGRLSVPLSDGFRREV